MKQRNSNNLKYSLRHKNINLTTDTQDQCPRPRDNTDNYRCTKHLLRICFGVKQSAE